MNFLLNSGLMSVTFWAALITFLVVLFSWFRASRTSERALEVTRGYWFLLGSTFFFLFLLFGTALNFGYGLYKSYVAPRDLMQDIVSAQQLLQGESLYPDQLNVRIRQALEAEPPRLSLFWWSPTLLEREQAARNQTFQEPWAQAHPPLMTLLIAPFVAISGVLGAQIAMALMSLLCLFLTLYLLDVGLRLSLNRRQSLVLVLGILGAAPIVSVFRLGQSGLLLGFLMVLGWTFLRKQRSVAAGICLALATAIKLYPGLLLLYFVVYDRRAFLAGAVALVLLFGMTGALVGWETYGEFFRTLQSVTDRYPSYSDNISVLGILTRPASMPLIPLAKPVFLALGGVLVVGALWHVHRSQSRSSGASQLDYHYSLFMVLMPLLSPIAWDHYLAILLLPMAVIGRKALSVEASWGEALGFLLILLILATPGAIWTWPYSAVSGPIQIVINVGWLSLRAYALLALAFWLARFSLEIRSGDDARKQGR